MALAKQSKNVIEINCPPKKSLKNENIFQCPFQQFEKRIGAHFAVQWWHWPFVNKIHFIAACLSGEWPYFKKSTKGGLKFHVGFQAFLKSNLNFHYPGISQERFHYLMGTIEVATARILCC